jgi:hypothetical protein
MPVKGRLDWRALSAPSERSLPINHSEGTCMPPHPATPSIEQWAIEKLVFYVRNPRKNDSAVDRMCASIREFGFKIPMLARGDGEIVDGHLRLKAARKLGSWPGGDTTVIAVILCDEWKAVLALDGVGAIHVLALGRFDLATHLLSNRSREEPADRMRNQPVAFINCFIVAPPNCFGELPAVLCAASAWRAWRPSAARPSRLRPLVPVLPGVLRCCQIRWNKRR